jgi:hypothetical protein
MTTKNRLVQNWVTTIFGTLMMLTALAMLIANRIPEANIDFGWWEMLGTALLGWVFLMAKDSLLEGLFMGIFKIPAKEDK